MKKIVFDKIQVNNFLSYGSDGVSLSFKQGINFITGHNKDQDSRNGVGKTSLIVDALSFVLFGKPYRNITLKEVKNRTSNLPCSVTVWYSINDTSYEVTRTISPNTLKRKINGVDEGNKTISETTKEILNDLGITKEVFENTLVMTAKNSTSFFSQDKSLKTKFIEGILGLECFSELFKQAKEEYNSLNSKIGKDEAALLSAFKSYKEDKVYEESWESEQKKKIEIITKELDNLNSAEIEDVSEQITEHQKQKDDLEESKNKLNDKLVLIAEKDAENATNIKNISDNIKKIKNTPTICPTCKRPFEDHDSETIENELKQLNTDLELKKEKRIKIEQFKQNILQEYSNCQYQINNLINELNDLQKKQKLFENKVIQINTLSEKFLNLQEEKNPFLEKNKNTESNLKTQKEALEKDKDELKVLDGVKIVFSPTGVKASIIKMIMNVFNERFAFYLQKLNTPCKIEFDEFFEEKVTDLKGQEISYDSLSEGEKGRVNFSLLFAFRDIRRLQSNVTINISVFDELFDSSIDANASAQILEILEEMSESQQDCYYIITHNETNVSMNGANIIYLEKENGITKIL